jgi:transcriptional regulator with XRE-family HTH domain
MSTQTHGVSVPEWTMGDRLRKAREEFGLSQKDMAATLGVARNTIGNYELGATEPSAATLRAWARACRVPAEWLAWGYTPGDQKPPGYRSVLRLGSLRPALVAAA